MNALKNPLLLVGLAVGGFLLFRSATAAPKVAGASSRTTADYFNPVDLAASFARLGIAISKGISTSVPTSLSMTKANAPGIGGATLDGYTQFGGGTLFGWSTLGTGGLGDPIGSWSLPSASMVRDSSFSRYSTETDSIVAGPLYDLATDYQQNPFSAIGL